MPQQVQKVIRLGEASVVTLPIKWARAHGVCRKGIEEPRFVIVSTIGDMMIVRPCPNHDNATPNTPTG